MSNISMTELLARSAPACQRALEAVAAAVEHRPPAGHARAVDICRGVVDEQDRLRRRDAHARLGCGEEHALRLAHAERRRIDDLVEMRAEASVVAQPGRAMMLLVGRREDAAAGTPAPGIGLPQQVAIDDPVLLEPVS